MLVNIKENELTRDHTERMLKGMGAEIFTDNEGFINIKPLTSSKTFKYNCSSRSF